MEEREIRRVEPAALHQHERERVSHRERRRRARRRGERQRTGFLANAHVEHHVGTGGERRSRRTRHRDQLEAESLEQRQHREDLARLPAVRDRDHGIPLHDGAEIAVHALSRVQEECRRSRARQRRGDLPGDDAGLAEPGDDDLPGGRGQQLDGQLELRPDALADGSNGIGLDLENTPARAPRPSIAWPCRDGSRAPVTFLTGSSPPRRST